MNELGRIVDGATRLYGIIGDPIAQVGSPRAFTQRFRAAGRNAILVPLHVLPTRFDETVRGVMALGNLDGLIATVPYKARILKHIDRVLPTAEQVGAVNAMRREPDGKWTGDMFDGRGLVRGLAGKGHSVAGKRVLLIGAGGAGSAIACALAEAGAAAITLTDLDAEKARALAGRVTTAFPGCKVVLAAPPAPVAEGHDVIINATPIGMKPDDGLPAPLGQLAPQVVVADVILKEAPTALLRHAQACGCPTMGGQSMLEGQVDEMLRFFGVHA